MNGFDDVNLENQDEVFVSSNEEYISENESFDVVPSPQELHERYQEFLRANGSRNNSSSEYQDDFLFDKDERPASHLNMTGSSHESDCSLLDVELKDMKQRNKNVKQRNDELRLKNDLLLRSVETFEEEAEKNKIKIQELEKELKSFHELERERENLHQDMEQLREELEASNQEKTAMEEEVKRLRDEEGFTLDTLNNMREQMDALTTDNGGLAVSNQFIVDENMDLRSKCDSLQSELELKSAEVEQKEQIYQQAKLQADECLLTIKNLQEEKEALMNEFREIQLEVSIYQNFHKQPEEVTSPNSPASGRILSNLKLELAAAEQSGDGSLLGPKEFRFPNSPRTNDVFSGLPNRSLANASFNSSTFGTPVPESRAVTIVKENNFTQTENRTNLDCQSQTDQDVIAKNEFEALITVQEHCSDIKEQLLKAQEENESLLDYLDLERTQKKYFLTQMEVLRKKTSSLQTSLDQKADENLQLTDIISKLCTNKLSTVWFLENFEGLESDLSSSNESGKVKKDFLLSPVIDSLSLECWSTTMQRNCNQTQPKEFESEKSVKKLYHKMAVCLQSDEDSIKVRKLVLEKCRTLLFDAIASTFAKLQDSLRDDPYQLSDPCCNHAEADSYLGNLHRPHAVGGHVRALQGLLSRVANVADGVATLDAHAPCYGAFKVFMRHTADLKRAIRVLKKRNASLAQTIENVPRPFYQHQTCADSSERSLIAIDRSVDEISNGLVYSVMCPYFESEWAQGLLSNDVMANLFRNLLVASCKFQRLAKRGRKPLLVLLFLICCYLSVSPADYRRKPVW